MKRLEIICPLYEAERYIEKLHTSLLKQQDVNISKISYVLTESRDNTESLLKSKNISYKKIKKENFSHSLSREKEALTSESDILVFITQDVQIVDEFWLYNLVKNIGNDDIVASYSRQLTKFNNIEKYIREHNYPIESQIKSSEDIPILGLKTFFFSDAASAVDTKVFKELHGYDGKDLPFSEDMYIAYKIIMAGYKIQYCADSIVYHSHDFSLKEIYDRYRLAGEFFKENPYLTEYSATDSGIDLAKYVFTRLIEEKRVKLLLRFPFDMIARYLGMKVGQR